MSRTTSDFIDGLKRRITMPSNQSLLDDADILAIASDVIETKLVKLLVSSKQNYLLTSEDFPLVAGQAGYDIPYRAVSGGLKDVKYVAGDGSLKDLSLVDIEDLQMYATEGATPDGFYFQDDQLVLVPTPETASGSLRLYYYRTPSRLCLVSAAAQVSNISGDIVTVSSAPATFVAGFDVDFVKTRSLSTALALDASISDVSGTQITFDADVVPSRLVQGDWLAPAFQTPVVPVPDSCLSYLEAMTGVQVLKSIGDYEGSKNLYLEAQDAEKDVVTLLEPRIDGEGDKIVNYSGLLRQKTYRRFFL